MKSLLWKDFRVNLFVLAFGVVMLLLPFLAGLTRALYLQSRGDHVNWWQSETWVMLSLGSLALSLLTIAMLGGNAIAAERADRSAEFLAYLPPSRWRVLISKMILAGLAGSVIWGVNLLVIYGLALHMTGAAQMAQSLDDGNFDVVLPGLASTAALLFGAGWLSSCLSNSPGIATGGGIFAPVLVAGVLGAIDYYVHPPGFRFAAWYIVACTALGGLTLLFGTAYYLRRVES